MGSPGAIGFEEADAHLKGPGATGGGRGQFVVLLVAAVIFLGCVVSPPALMDDMDATQAQIARTMLDTGDWVTARINGVIYLEKPPLKYWLIALSFRIFGVHDWAARIPTALAAVLLGWVTALFGTWAFDARAGTYAGLCLATCAGLFLFTRVLLPDVMLTLTITVALWALLRALDTAELHPRRWAMLMWAALGTGLLLKGLIAIVFPVAAGVLFLLITRQLFLRKTWHLMHPVAGMVLFLAIALPWHVLATIRNPPHFDFTLHSERGSYHGFFWFYFINEHLLRYLGRRYPRDYNTVPRLYFWLFHLIWLFPWSVYLPAVAKLNFKPADRAGRTRLLAFCWIGFILLFFSFSTTQEYYSMPCYPALALLIGCALTSEDRLLLFGTRAAAVVATLCFSAIAIILWLVRAVPTPGDISVALNENPDIYTVYTLSLGHMGDLTLRAFAYLRLPLALAGLGLLIGAAGAWKFPGRRAVPVLVLMMVLFFHAARLALVTFDPYLGSRPLADALNRSPEGQLIVDDQYYAFSSLMFYSNRRALLLNGRVNNIEYGSYAPSAPDVFLDDQQFARLWSQAERYYLVAERPAVSRFEKLVGKPALHVVVESGGKFLFTNR
ncbi:MAG TPA: glycosyltransferase family 39 protein [Bryobacteraceae bacterium]|nr:glycosyltransferase family 39 protein [Bryobacteraceae bacterium]